MNVFANMSYKKLKNIALVVTLLLVVFFSLKATLETKEVNGKIYTEMNNYQIFKGVFKHTLQQKNLYKKYPDKYFNENHYGPFFSLIIAPFTVFNDHIGVVLWGLANCLLLLFAFAKLTSKPKLQFFILLLMVNDFANNALNTQINSSIAAMIILSFFYTEKGKEQWATFFIFIGAFIKIYTLVGLVFFFFSKRKLDFIKYSVLWSILFFIAPMAISSPEFILQSYADWFTRIQTKNQENLNSAMQNMDISGLIRKITNNPNIHFIPFLIAGTSLFLLVFTRIKQYKFYTFRLQTLILSLIYVVIFSSGSESPTYIIAVVGISIWAISYVRKENKTSIVLLIIAILLTILASTDIFPSIIRHRYTYPYKIKAIGASLIWFYVLYKTLTSDFKNFQTNKLS